MNIDGPIPGENYLRDTKNFPWHRPPEFKSMDEAIEYSAKHLTEEKASIKILTMMEAGVPVSTLVDMYLTSGIGSGKWTPDFALLMAGPVAHIMCLMAKGYGVEYDLGVEDKKGMPTKVFLDEMAKIDKNKAKSAAQEAMKEIGKIQEQAPKTLSGFMAASLPEGIE